MSIVRVGMGEKKGYAEGYDAIFGKKKATKKTPAPPAAKAKPASPKKTTKKKK